MTTLKPTRRTLLAGAAAVPLVAILKRPAFAAEFRLKYATGQAATHPVNIRAQEAIDRIREATSGRVDIRLFPANQLGADTDLLSQVRSGAVEFFNVSSLILATFVPLSGMTSLGFAFQNYDDVWRAMDGPFGDHIRAEIAKRPIFAMNRIWDNGFRQITSSGREIRTPEDLQASACGCHPRRRSPRCSRRSARGRRRSTSTSSTPRCRPTSSRARRTRSPSSRPGGSTRCRRAAR